MNPVEIYDKAYEKYPVKMAPDDDTMGFTSTDVNEAARMAYIEAYKEISALPTIKGWVARDMNGNITLYENKPFRDGEIWRGCSWKSSMIYDILLPGIKWEDEPIEVELLIIRK